MSVVSPGVSEFQKPLDKSYRRRLAIFRAAFGTNYQDKHFLENANAAKALHDAGKLDGAIVYLVPIFSYGTPQEHFAFLKKLIGPTVPDWIAAFEIDLETWGGASYEQHGDHSAYVNTLGELIRKWSQRRVLIYANHGDLAELAPHRNPYPVEVASYGTQLNYKDVSHAIGQQYTNGTIQGPAGLPLATQPFGNCCHTVFPGFKNAKALVDYFKLKPAPTPQPKPKPKPAHEPNIDKARAALTEALKQHPKHGPVHRAVQAALNDLKGI